MFVEKMPTIENKSRKEELKTEFGALRRDWLKSKGVNLENAKISELKEYINSFYKENRDVIAEVLEQKSESLESELAEVSLKNFNVNKVAIIRDKIGLPKKISLSETVAFIKTIVDLDDQQLKEKYFEYCSEGISLDDMRKVLAFDNDVKPARLDTDIYHQSPQRSRSAVEIVSNAIDALKNDGNTIGRFGVGFYQILSHLQTEEDYVRVETGDEKNGFYTLEFSLKDKEVQIHLEKNESQKTSGTIVVLHAKEFPKEEAENLIKKHFAYNNVSEVFCNGKNVNNLKNFDIKQTAMSKINIEINEEGFKVIDNGVGMSPQVILEKLIVPKFSGKKSVREILGKENIEGSYFVERRKEKEDKSPGKVVLNVGGVMIEEIEVVGINSVKTVVIDLPPFTMLGEERNEVAVDEITIKAIKDVIKKVAASKDIEVLNSIAPLVQKLQNRSLNHEEKNDLLKFLQGEAKDKLDKNLYYLPNANGFERVENEKTVLLDPNIMQTNWNKIPNFYIPKLTGSGKVIFVSPLKNDIDVPVVDNGNRLLLDSNIYEFLKKEPTLLNLYLDTLSKATGDTIRNLEQIDEEGLENNNNKKERRRSYKDAKDFILKEWQLLGFLTEGSVKIYCKNIEKYSETYQKFELIYKYFINDFPKNISKYILAQSSNESEEDRWVNEETFNILSTLNKNKELVEFLDELDINILNYEEKEYEKYPNFFPTPKALEEPLLKNWDFIYYYGYGNLIDSNGKVYQNIKPDGMRIDKSSSFGTSLSGQTKAIFGGILFKKDEGDLYFMDLKSKEQRKIFEANGESEWETAENSEKRAKVLYLKDKRIIPLMNHGSFSSRTFKEFSEYIIVQDTQFIDFDTGDIFNPRPDLGIILGYNNEAIIYSSAKDRYHHENERVIYTAYYLDGSTKVLHPDDSRYYKTLSEEVGIKSIAEVIQKGGEVITSIGGKEVASFPTRFYKERNIDRASRGQSTLDLDWYIKEGLSIKELKSREKNFILYRNVLSEDSEEKRLGDGNADYIYKGSNSECILFDQEGNEIFRASPEEYVRFHKQTNGEPVLLCLSFNPTERRSYEFRDGKELPPIKEKKVYIEKDSYIKDFSKIKKLVFRDLSGDIIKDEALKNLEPILFKTGGAYGKHSEYEYGKGAFSPYQGDKWEIDVRGGNHSVTYSYGGPYKYNDQTLYIVDRETGKEIFPYNFSSVIYDPEKDQWECKIFENEKRTFGGEKDEWVNKIICINKKGKIIEKFELAGQSNLYKNYKYDLKVTKFNHFPLSKEKTDIMYKLLSENPGEAKKEIERFIGRCFRYGNLSDKSFAQIIPILLKVEELDPALIDDNTILSLEVRLTKYDMETRAWFYTLLSKMVSRGINDKEIFIEKFIKIYENKIAHLPQSEKETVFKTLDQVRDYRGEYLTTGWNIIQSKTPVPSELLPEKIRPIVDFLRTNEKESMTSVQDTIKFKSKIPITLSQLIQTKRLNETKIQQFSGSVHDLLTLVNSKTKDKKQDHIKREIIHPIYYQGVNNPYLFIRELVQNAHDAVIVDPKSSRKDVTVDIFSQNTNEVTLRMEDGAGMSLQELLNYFLIPGETTKLDEEKTIGYFGQGLFTLFRNSKEVVLRTSKGDGIIQKLKITPKLGVDGEIDDLNLILEQEKGKFKGTTIERTVATKFPTVESSYIKNAVCTYTSLVDGNVIGIKLNGTKINNPQNVLASLDIPKLGVLKLYDAPNNVVTQKGLFVKGIDADYKTNLNDVEELLEKRGYVLNLPDFLSLTRSRNEIAQKEGVLPEIQKYLPLLKMKAYLEIFRQDIIKGRVIQLDNLPYDYFFMDYSPNNEIEIDAKMISQGEPIKDVGRYIDRGSLIHLLVLLPAVELEGKVWSIFELKKASLEDKPPLENKNKYYSLPSFLREKLTEGKVTHSSMSSAMSSAEEKGEVVEDFSLESWEKQPDSVKKIIKKQYNQYKRMVNYLEKYNHLLAESYGDEKAIRTTLYMDPGTKAHASKNWNMIGWNIGHWKDWRLNFEEENEEDRSLFEFLSTYSHEYSHIKERTSDMTHNKDFYHTQAKIISRLINIKKNDNHE